MDYTIVNGELYHYGVMGMKWGRRKGPKEAQADSKPKQKKRLTPEEKQARINKGKKIAAGVLAGVGVIAATTAAVYLAKKHKKSPTNIIQPKSIDNDDIITSMGNIKRSERLKKPVSGSSRVKAGDVIDLVDTLLYVFDR